MCVCVSGSEMKERISKFGSANQIHSKRPHYSVVCLRMADQPIHKAAKSGDVAGVRAALSLLVLMSIYLVMYVMMI